jgi:hypothetical protein
LRQIGAVMLRIREGLKRMRSRTGIIASFVSADIPDKIHLTA